MVGTSALSNAPPPFLVFFFPAGKKKRETAAACEREKKKEDVGWVNWLVYGRHVSVGYATCVAGTATRFVLAWKFVRRSQCVR
jgi:hypothetical protein